MMRPAQKSSKTSTNPPKTPKRPQEGQSRHEPQTPESPLSPPFFPNPHIPKKAYAVVPMKGSILEEAVKFSRKLGQPEGGVLGAAFEDFLVCPLKSEWFGLSMSTPSTLTSKHPETGLFQINPSTLNPKPSTLNPKHPKPTRKDGQRPEASLPPP